MKDWKRAVVTAETTVQDAMRAIDVAGLKIVFVCDDQAVLLGTVTDGDIRRGLLKDLQLDHPVRLVMNTQPKTSDVSASQKSQLELLESNDLEVLPILNANRKLVAVETIKSLRAPQSLDNPVFIMAGGFGTRLRPLTDNCPKPMLPVAGKPLLEHLVERFIAQGFWKFYISTHYLPERIVEHFGDGTDLGVRIEYVHEQTPLGTGGALSLLPPNSVSSPLVLINGDVLADVDFTAVLEFHNLSQADATMCLRQQETSIAYGVVETHGKFVSTMVEKPTYSHLINTGIYVLSPELVNAIDKPRKIDLPTLLEQRMELGFKIAAYKMYGLWLDIGKLSDYNKAQEELKGSFF